MELCTASIRNSAQRSHISTLVSRVPYHRYACSRSRVSQRRRKSSFNVMNTASTSAPPSSRNISQPAQTNGTVVKSISSKKLNSTLEQLDIECGVCIPFRKYSPEMVRNKVLGSSGSILSLASRGVEIIWKLGFYWSAGQVLANRPDIIREDYMSELCILQDDVPPFANQMAFSIIEEELGQPLEQLFSKISSETIAAASLGQVYRATLRNRRGCCY